MTVGETLSRARRKRGLSLDDVAAETRIRSAVIAAIEGDDFKPCGGTVYARGHIRSIARVVGVDPGSVLGEFDAVHQAENVVAAVAATPPDQDLVASAQGLRPNWTVAMAAALVVICGFAIYGLIAHDSSSPRSPRADVKVTHPSAQPSSTPSSPPPSSVAQLPTASEATMLVRTVSGRTWLSVTTKNGRTLFSGILEAGQHKAFSDRHGLAYVIGNAPVVDVVVNGNDIGSPPSSNVVARGSVVPGKGTVQQA